MERIAPRTAHDARGWLGGLSTPALALGVALGYGLLGQLTVLLNDPVNNGASFWPSAGWTVGVLLLLPSRRWPVIVLAVALSEGLLSVVNGFLGWWTLGWMVANAIEPVVGAAVVRRLGNRSGRLTPLPNLLAVLCGAVLVGPTVAALIGGTSTALAYGYGIVPTVFQWTVGDALGVLVIAPLVLAAASPSDPRAGRREAALLAIAVVTVLATGFAVGPDGWGIALPMAVVPLLTWAALRFDVRGTTWTVAVVANVANVATAVGAGPFSGADRAGILADQLFVGTLAASALILAVVRGELMDRDEVALRLLDESRRDHVTGLPNRRWLMPRVAGLAAAQGRVALLLCDVDHFKDINDAFGHPTGDALLRTMADRIVAAVGTDGEVSRLGGDEFVVVVPGATSEQAADVAARIVQGVAVPIEVAGISRTTSVSVGIACADADVPTTAEQLLRDADLAMYQAKERGRGRSEHFDDVLRVRLLERLNLEAEIGDALADRDIGIVVQPEVDLRTGALFGAEALARWNREGHEVGPDRFVPVTIAAGLAPALLERVLDDALAARASWVDTVPENAGIAVNVSPTQLGDTALVDLVVGRVERHGLSPRVLWLEVTEEALDVAGSDRVLTLLRDAGVRVALDDFGIGWSSMGRLASSRWDLLKIDRSFVARIDHDHGVRVVESMIAMARVLEIPVLAEGVEHRHQLERLVDIGCDFAQGHLFSRPLAPDALPSWEATRSRRLRALR